MFSYATQRVIYVPIKVGSTWCWFLGKSAHTEEKHHTLAMISRWSYFSRIALTDVYFFIFRQPVLVKKSQGPNDKVFGLSLELVSWIRLSSLYHDDEYHPLVIEFCTLIHFCCNELHPPHPLSFLPLEDWIDVKMTS